MRDYPILTTVPLADVTLVKIAMAAYDTQRAFPEKKLGILVSADAWPHFMSLKPTIEDFGAETDLKALTSSVLGTLFGFIAMSDVLQAERFLPSGFHICEIPNV